MNIDTNLYDAELIPSQKGPPHALFAAWREQDPVHWNPPNPDYRTVMQPEMVHSGFWVLTRYQDVFDVSRDQETFTSHDGGPVIWDMYPEQLALQQAGLMGMQPQQHQQIKRLIMPAFSPKALADFAAQIDRAADDIVNEIAGRGECEFVFDVASRLPVYTFCELMGIDESMRETVFRLGNETADIENRDPNVDPTMELFQLAMQVSEEQRDSDKNSIMTRLLNGELDGEKLDDLQVQMFFVTMSVAGHETTRSTLSHFIRLMHKHPEQRELLMSDLDTHLPNAIHEVLRVSPPVIKFRRTATKDATIGDTKVQKGDKIYISYPAANRDPSVFEDPDRFDITRANASDHLSFGTGPHVCVGARLALMQMQALLTRLYTRLPDLQPDSEIEFLKSIWFSAPINMPVRFTPEK